MVSAISGFDPISYLRQINTVSKTAAAASVAAVAPVKTSTTPATTKDTTESSSAPLLSVPTSLLSLLQGSDSSDSSDSNNQFLSLFGMGNNNKSTDPLAGVYSALASKTSQIQSYQDAINNVSQVKADNLSNTHLQNILDQYHNGLNGITPTKPLTA